MKKWIFMLLLAGSIQGVYAQKAEKKEKFNPNTPLFEELTDVKKKTDKFNLYLNMQGSFDAHFQNGFQEGDFNMHQLRIEAKGNINNWLSYRYRQRLNRSNDANGMIDNLPTSIDYAGIGIKLNDQFSLFAGKQCAAYGGIGVSATQAVMDYYGVSKTSAEARDNGGVKVNGQMIDAQTWYQTIGANGTGYVGSMYVYSMTNVRLGELTLGYDIPINKWCKWISGLNVSFVGRNLWMLYCKAPFDPESTASTGTYNQGMDYFMQPSLRSMGFSAKISF